MQVLKKTRGTIRFGNCEVDLSARELRRNGRRIRLQDQAFEILALLLRNPGMLVTREEMRQVLWPGDTFVDFEHGLNRVISRLREALGDSVISPKFIETVARHGYRFVAPTEVVQGAGQVLAGRKLRIAVLPFANLSGDPAQEFFSDGITEEMIAQLGRVHPERLGVIARTSAMQYKGCNKGVDQIGRELQVDYILEGSVRRVVEHVRITAQLIAVDDQTHLWTESYDWELEDVLAIQLDVATRVRRSLATALLSAREAKETRVPTGDSRCGPPFPRPLRKGGE